MAAACADAMAAAANLVVRRVSLARTVRRASPLLLDALAARGVDLGAVLDRLPARYEDWRTRVFGHRAPVATLYARPRRRPRLPSPWSAGAPSTALTPASGEGLRLVWSGAVLGLSGSAGRLRIATAGATAWLGIDGDLPETLRTALVGRPVDALVSHPLLDGRDYTVLRVEADADGSSGTLIEVRTGLRRCRAPWTPRQAVDAGSAVMLDLVGAPW